MSKFCSWENIFFNLVSLNNLPTVMNKPLSQILKHSLCLNHKISPKCSMDRTRNSFLVKS